MTGVEERRFTARPVEVRAGDNGKVGGYASVFGRPSRNLGGFVEVVDPGFFAKSEGDGWPGVVALFNHDDMYLLGTADARTLTLRVDKVGLDYTVTMPQARADVLELIARGDVRSSSFAFHAFADDWSVNGDGYPLRTLLSGQLFDVSAVTRPAYPDASVGLRSLAKRAGAPIEEVRKLAQRDELRKLLVRTERVVRPPAAAVRRAEPPTMQGAAAVVALLARRTDPYV